ncbi:MAG: choice-of-anchor D domain-containing protein [Deltaproteobacteria bacterium]|nr:choice-of-anchor D domain-containing protein [Deltaproteobacteria bacterium]
MALTTRVGPTTSITRDYEIRSTPPDDLVSITKTGVDCNQFQITTDEVLPEPVTPGNPVHMHVKFTAAVRGTVSCTLTFNGLVGTGMVIMTGNGEGPAIQTQPVSAQAFPDVRVDGAAVTTATAVIRIVNIGDANNDLEITSLGFSGSGAADFSVSPTPLTIPAGQFSDVTVTFDPTMPGLRTASLDLVTNDLENPTYSIDVSGTGTTGLIMVDDVTFGLVMPGGAGTARNINVTNVGAPPQGPLRILSATITQTSTWFTLDDGGCAGMTSCVFTSLIAPDTVGVRCKPPAGATGTQTARVTFASDTDPGGDDESMLTCTSGAPQIMVAPLSLTFPNQLAGTTSANMAFMISNVGNATLTYSVAASGGTPAAFPFSASCTTNCTLDAGMSRMVTVQFNPTAPSPFDTTIVVTSNDPDVADRTKNVLISGTGVAPQITVAGSLDFMTVNVGANSSLPLTAMNTGTAPLDISSATITSGAADFMVTAGTTTAQSVAVNGAAMWTIRCAPSASGPRTGTFRIVSNSFTSSTRNVTLTCTGNAGALASTPATSAGAPIDFGGVTVGTTRTLSFSLSNPGNVPVTGISAVLAPANVGYSIDAAMPVPTTLAAGGSQTVSVTFAPMAGTDGGPATITITGTWGGTNTVMVTVHLMGDGLTAGFDVSTIPATSPPAIDFGTFRWDATATGTFCIVNTDQTPVTIQSPISITPNAPTVANELQVTGVRRNTTCSATGGSTVTLPQTLTQGQILVVTVVADPADRTGLLSGSLTVTSNLLLNPTRTITMTGMSTTAMLTTTPGLLIDFGNVDRDGPPATRMVTITNTGSAPLDLSGFTRNPINGPFTFTLPGASTVPVGGQVDINVTYTPVTEHAPGQSEQVVISHNIAGILNGPTSQMITIRGRGVDRHIALDAAPVFPDTFRNPGSAAPVRTVTVRNTGEAPLSISAVMLTNDDVWQLLDTSPVTIPPNGSHDFMVRFLPKVAGKAPVGQLTFMNNDNSSPTPMAIVLLNGNGIDRSVMMGDPEIAFGLTAIGIPVTIEDKLTITSMDQTNGFTIRAITIDDPENFVIEEAPMGVNLAAGASVSYSVTFTPTTEGVFETRAHLFLDEDPTAQADVILRGQAVFVEVDGGGGCSAGGGGATGGAGLVLGLLALARRRRVAVIAAALTVCAMPALTRAEPNLDLDLSLFNPTPSTTGNNFQIQPASVGDNGDFAAAATVSYATNPLVLKFAGSEHGSITQRTTMELGIAYAFLGRFEAGVRMPLYNQSGDGTMVGVASPSGTARGDLVLHGKLRFVRSESASGVLHAGAALALTLPTATSQEFAGVAKPTGRILGLLTYTPSAMTKRLSISANLGAVLREAVTLSNIEQGSGAAWGLGVSFRALDQLWIAGELFGDVMPGGRKATSMSSGSMLAPAELLAGINYRPDPRVAIGLAVGRGLIAGPGTPDLRGVASISYMPGTVVPQPLSPPKPPKVDGDADKDGVVDSLDRCVNEAEDADMFDDTDGCPDFDNDADGFLDPQDKCPLDAEDKDGFQDDDGCPEKDNDADGINDAQDKCIDQPEDKDGHEDVDGCPDADNDSDGMLDAQDACPNEPEAINGITDDDGCPDRGDALVVVTPSGVEIIEAVQFTGTTVSKASTNVLNQIGATLRAHQEIVRLKIVVHVQPTGDDAKDQERSDKRAAAMRDWLVQWGVAANRLSVMGLGGSKPLVPAKQKNAALINDRVELIILERK